MSEFYVTSITVFSMLGPGMAIFILPSTREVQLYLSPHGELNPSPGFQLRKNAQSLSKSKGFSEKPSPHLPKSPTGNALSSPVLPRDCAVVPVDTGALQVPLHPQAFPPGRPRAEPHGELAACEE